MMPSPETRYAKSGDAYIAYQVFGEGPPLVVAVGYMSHLEQNWELPYAARFYQRLGSFAKVLLFDRRGTGLSDRIGTPATFDEMMDDIRAVMDAAGVERAALVGGAEGGPMCMLFAATFPERTSALILTSTYARRMVAPDYPWGMTEAQHQLILATYDARWGREPMGISRVAPSLADVPRYREWYLKAMRYGGTPGAARSWYRLTTEIDVRHVLPAIRVQTLVVHWSGDRAVPVAAGRYLAEHIPGAKFIELHGNDHMWYSEHQDEVLDVIQEFLTGVQPVPEPDRVLVTVLFTDIVESTSRAATLGDRQWRNLLESHNEIVRRELERFRGKEVQTAGDGFLATFDGPVRAIRCAQEITKAVRTLGIDVRAGLHTGEIELLGHDIRGIAVHIAARVMARAGAGEVLVSSTVKDIVAGSGLEFEDRDTHQLKGVPGEWRLFLAR
jgi:class 3 adenylate cyclase